MSSQARSVPGSDLTYEGIVENILALLRQQGVLLEETKTISWDAFLRLSNLVHENYNIPATAFTPIMRRLLFAIGFAYNPQHLVGVGTYVGYTFSWLLRNRADYETAPFFQTARGFDVNAEANALARCNCNVLGHGDRLTFIDADGVVAVAESKLPIDLLYLDLDDPLTGKIGYQRVLESALSHLHSGSLILAHDACVKVFETDLANYHRFVRESGLFFGPWILPVDSYGLSVVMVR